METIEVAGEDAVQELNRLRGQWSVTKQYPFMVGSDEDLASFMAVTNPGEVDSEAIIEDAMALDLPAWLKENGPAKKATWPKEELPPQTAIVGLADASGALKSKMHIGLVEVSRAWHVFAKLGYGGWGDCPPPHVHVAMHKYWSEKHKASPIYISHDSVEMVVGAPAEGRKEALTLAAEQYAYCHEIVEQGAETVGKLASSLAGSRHWNFWWE